SADAGAAGAGANATGGGGTGGSSGSGPGAAGAAGTAGAAGSGDVARVGVCGVRSAGVVTADSFETYEEHYLLGDEGFGDALCVVRFDVRRAGDAPDGCDESAGQQDMCLWTHLVEYSNPSVLVDEDGPREDSELAMDGAAIAATDGQQGALERVAVRDRLGLRSVEDRLAHHPEQRGQRQGREDARQGETPAEQRELVGEGPREAEQGLGRDEGDHGAWCGPFLQQPRGHGEGHVGASRQQQASDRPGP